MAARTQASSDGHGHLIREAEAIAGGALALFLALSLFSYSADTPHSNLGGLVGHRLADTALHALGLAAYLFPLYLIYFIATLLRRDTTDLGGLRLAGAGLLVLSVAALAGLATQGRPVVRGGGWLGGFVGSAMHDLLGGIGATLFLSVLLLVALVLATGVSAIEMASVAGRWIGAAAGDVLARSSASVRGLFGRAPATTVRLPQRPRRVAPAPVLLDDALDEDGEPDRPPIIREPERRPEGPKRERVRRNDDQADLFAPDKYRLPALSLLDAAVRTAQPIDEAALLASSRILQTKLADFGVAGKVLAVRPGPVITTFEFEPAPGVKVSRIVGLADDLAMALRAASVRILAPIPGKPVVGVEVSNPRRDKVFISEMMQSDGFRGAASKICLALGKDTTGNVVVDDLSRMPHLLIAGATGTGKSVSMNAMIMSILYKATPRDVRLIMIDPKMLELSTYENIPHLLVPVVTDPKKAAAALNNMIREMDDRYRLLHDKGVRNVDSYNRALAAAIPAEEPAAEEPEEGDDAPAAAVSAVPATAPIKHRHLPRIVVIIDELADLMMTVGHEIEESITRLAQKARAAGIHLIIATQRPSVDVITGLIKANFPARLSFQVTTRVDSRTILDAIGAERLLGDGDMLFLPPGTARVQRLHGAFVSDDEVHKVVDFIKKQEQPHYQMELLEGGDDEEDGDDDLDEDMNDEQYDKAVRLVTEHQQASISWLQRRLRVGYNRAARMIERMEREGVVSAARGAGPREVLARRIED